MGQVEEAITHSTLVRANPEKVYDAITTAEALDGWFTTGAEVEPRSGGHIKFRWRDWGADKVSSDDGGPVIEAERPKRFVFKWFPAGEEYSTMVEIDFEPADEGTIIRLRESGYRDDPRSKRAMLACAVGWGEALTLLKYYVEHGHRY
ncbi:MAG: SRPBCC family protein [Candidatus Thorarchaeota archaeon]|jgi:uncharacterized protein YndB with AHSA1/START domain